MAFLESALDRPVRRGKVRDVYDLGDRLLLVATDRISAYDWVLPTGIPDKGRVLNGLSDDGSPWKALELLMDKIKTTRSNDEFLAEVAKTQLPV